MINKKKRTIVCDECNEKLIYSENTIIIKNWASRKYIHKYNILVNRHFCPRCSTKNEFFKNGILI